jgi:hypothetical protein
MAGCAWGTARLKLDLVAIVDICKPSHVQIMFGWGVLSIFGVQGRLAWLSRGQVVGSVENVGAAGRSDARGAAGTRFIAPQLEHSTAKRHLDQKNNR